eukprot:COSAG04_NODE_516_length_13191_cov_3.382371_1_plen_224_part_00
MPGRPAVLLLAVIHLASVQRGRACDSSGDCQHGGTCSCTTSKCGGTCSCPSPYSGNKCQNDPCTGHNCNGHGHCSVSGSSYTCSCNGKWSGTNCQNDPCHGQTCSGHGSCQVNRDDFKCNCAEGYTGSAHDCSTRVSCGNVAVQLHGSASTAQGSHSSGCSGSKSYGDDCTAVCDKGYTHKDRSATITCRAHGQTGYYDGSIDCERAPPPPPPRSPLALLSLF